MPIQKPRLLVIDDDAQIRRVYGRLLGRVFEVDCVEEASAALKSILTGPTYDAILCDRNLGAGLTGDQLFALLPPKVQARTVMCSGTALDTSDPFAMGLGERFFLKLSPMSELIALLQRVSRPSLIAA